MSPARLSARSPAVPHAHRCVRANIPPDVCREGLPPAHHRRREGGLPQVSTPTRRPPAPQSRKLGAWRSKQSHVTSRALSHGARTAEPRCLRGGEPTFVLHHRSAARSAAPRCGQERQACNHRGQGRRGRSSHQVPHRHREPEPSDGRVLPARPARSDDQGPDAVSGVHRRSSQRHVRRNRQVHPRHAVEREGERSSHLAEVFRQQHSLTIYGVTGGADADTFAPVTFPAGQRTGLLGQASILAMRSRTNTTSVVSRGLYINSSMLCLVRPPEPPAAVKDKVTAQLMDATATERQEIGISHHHEPLQWMPHWLRSLRPVARELRRHRAIPSHVRGQRSHRCHRHAARGGRRDAHPERRRAREHRRAEWLVRSLPHEQLDEIRARRRHAGGCQRLRSRHRVRKYQTGDQTFTSMVHEVALSNTLSNRAVGQ